MAKRVARPEPVTPLGGKEEAAPWGVCLVPHPLLDTVLCQRLQGHPGAHGAEVETSSAEIYLEWAADEEQAE